MTRLSFFLADFFCFQSARAGLVPICLTSSEKQTKDAAVMLGREVTGGEMDDIGTLSACAASAD